MAQSLPPHPRRASRRLIRSFEAKALGKRPFLLKLADSLTQRFSSFSFLGFNILFFAAWITINLGLIPGIAVFDPFPFILLTMTVSLEAIILTIIVLMSQNRQSYIASLRDELQLQVNLLAEKEVTKALKLLIALHEHHQIKTELDPELKSMLKDIDTSYIERKLEDQIQGKQHTIRTTLTQPLVKLMAPKPDKPPPSAPPPQPTNNF